MHEIGLLIDMVIEFVANMAFLLYKCVHTKSAGSDLEVVRFYLNLPVAPI